ncbi:MAG TPA: N-methyl-L-tryptophan oxidase [Methylibium sp.]
MSPSFDVAVVGLGAMGSAAAYHLARQGRKVLGLDRFTSPHAFGSSHGLTRIIREAYFEDPCYVPLVQRAYGLWDELQRLAGRELLRITGGLMIGPADGVLVGGALRSAQEHGLAHELLSAAEVKRRFPALQPREDMVGVWEPRAGVLFPEACIAAHLALAQAHKAALRGDERVLSWRAEADGAVRITTERSEYRARQLLLTAGAWIRSMVPELALPFSVERQAVCWFAPTADPELFAPARCPVSLWETAPQKFLYGIPDFGDGMKLAVHHEGEEAAPDGLRREVGEAEVAAIRALVQRFVPGANGPLRSSAVCMYTNTPDQHFWIDRHPQHPQVLIASPCSGHGFKFAGVVGEALADWLITGQPRFDLSRFASR